MSISTNEISADFRLCRVMCIGKEGTPGGCKSQVPHLIDILLTMFYFNADHLNILCLLTSICFQLGESDLAWCILWWKARSTAHDLKSHVQTNLPEGLNKSNNVHLWLARLECFQWKFKRMMKPPKNLKIVDKPSKSISLQITLK